ncbi:mitochondrial inner membrane protein required for protein import [Malassezia sp. CBS 17886]|nr:mitochondrial inner membrane protein required for protein import [Malassezia sp. CBS 17886]
MVAGIVLRRVRANVGLGVFHARRPLVERARIACVVKSAALGAPRALHATGVWRVEPPKDATPGTGGEGGRDDETEKGQAGDARDGADAATAKHPDTTDAAPPRPRGGLQLDIDTTPEVERAIAGPGEDGDGGRGRTNARARADGGSSIDRSRRSMVRMMAIVSSLALAYAVWTLGRDLDEHEHEVFHDRDGVDSFFGRLRLRIQDLRDGMSKPVWEKLLPDPLPFPYSRPYTLVVDLDQLLVASSWSTAQGWRTAKRPGLDYFLGYLSQWYEIVLFTTQPFYVVEKVVEKLDPDRRYIAYQLFRESCRMHDGKLCKDISHLNRDPRKVVVLDINPEHVALQPENAIVLEPWRGDRDDRVLLGLIPFLDAIGIYGVEDVRNTLKAYQGKDIPTEYAKNETILKQRHEEEWRAKKERLGSFSIFGGAASGQSMSGDPPKTMLELERARFQQGYLEDQKFWTENGDALRKQMQEEQEKQLREMKLNAWEGVSRMFGGAGAPPPDGAPAGDAPPAK